MIKNEWLRTTTRAVAVCVALAVVMVSVFALLAGACGVTPPGMR